MHDVFIHGSAARSGWVGSGRGDGHLAAELTKFSTATAARAGYILRCRVDGLPQCSPRCRLCLVAERSSKASVFVNAYHLRSPPGFFRAAAGGIAAGGVAAACGAIRAAVGCVFTAAGATAAEECVGSTSRSNLNELRALRRSPDSAAGRARLVPKLQAVEAVRMWCQMIDQVRSLQWGIGA